jgi:hypothetical protein
MNFTINEPLLLQKTIKQLLSSFWWSYKILWGEVSHISRLFVVYALVVHWNTTLCELHPTDAIVPLVRSFVLGPRIAGVCDVSVMPPSPVLPEFRAWALALSLEARPPP